MDTPKRYHPLMVVLHWLTVILILGAGILSRWGSSSPISLHMIFGSLLLVTMITRLIVRFTVKRPAWANTGNPILNKLGELVHVGLYAAAFYILILGGLIAAQTNLLGYAFGVGSIVPDSQGVHMLHTFHGFGWKAVLGLLFLHIGGAVYHQFLLKDNLLNRMWFGRQL